MLKAMLGGVENSFDLSDATNHLTPCTPPLQEHLTIHTPRASDSFQRMSNGFRHISEASSPDPVVNSIGPSPSVAEMITSTTNIGNFPTSPTRRKARDNARRLQPEAMSIPLTPSIHRRTLTDDHQCGQDIHTKRRDFDSGDRASASTSDLSRSESDFIPTPARIFRSGALRVEARPAEAGHPQNEINSQAIHQPATYYQLPEPSRDMYTDLISYSTDSSIPTFTQNGDEPWPFHSQAPYLFDSQPVFDSQR
jgi:hypothetical protein